MNKGLITALIILGVASVYIYNFDNSIPQPSAFDQFKKTYAKNYLKPG
jgi:hypothetical protein